IVRTLPETFLIVLTPAGNIQKLLVLAFYEPQEYLPSDRWLRQFDQKTLDPNLRLQHDIHGIAGATLSARAVTSGVRKALALFQVLREQRQ
ncbi:MAG: FMN-binding protein, partial [Terriglobia bacterium]